MKPLKKILLIHTSNVLLHYRVAIYNYFSQRFNKEGYEFIVITTNLQSDNPHPINFELHLTKESTSELMRKYREIDPDIVISFTSLRHLFAFPVLFLHKIKKSKLIYWGHGLNLDHPERNRLLFKFWHKISNAIILYSPNELKYISKKNKDKVFIANNTLDLNLIDRNFDENIFSKFKISTTENIIFVGRIEQNKRLQDLIDSMALVKNSNAGLIIIGEDKLNLLPQKLPSNVFYLGPVYKEDLHSLLHYSKIFSIPGHVGLGIVDAFYHSLPIITENVKHAPEIFYLKNNENGFIVPVGDIQALSNKIDFLLDNAAERIKMGESANKTILKEGNIETMFQGFFKACNYVDEL